jgi:hypothetical protein
MKLSYGIVYINAILAIVKGQNSARCSELSATLDRLRDQIASVQAELGAQCNLTETNQTEGIAVLRPCPSSSSSAWSQSIGTTLHTASPTNEIEDQTDVGVAAPPALTRQSAGAAHDDAPSTHRIVRTNSEHTEHLRRSGGDGLHEGSRLMYAVSCWEAGSAFADRACNCLGEPPHPKLGSRQTIKVVVGSWYRRSSRAAVCKPRLIGTASSSDWQGTTVAYYPLSVSCGTRWACVVIRPAAAVDAFLLKITIEERLGWPVQLVSDGLVADIRSTLNLSGAASVYAALAAGDVDMYPEVRASG